MIQEKNTGTNVIHWFYLICLSLFMVGEFLYYMGITSDLNLVTNEGKNNFIIWNCVFTILFVTFILKNVKVNHFVRIFFISVVTLFMSKLWYERMGIRLVDSMDSLHLVALLSNLLLFVVLIAKLLFCIFNTGSIKGKC